LTDDYSGVIYIREQESWEGNWLVDSEWGKVAWWAFGVGSGTSPRHKKACRGYLMALIPLWGTKGGMHAVGSFR